MKLNLFLVFIGLAIASIGAKEIKKSTEAPNKSKDAESVKQANARPPYINQFSQSLKFLSLFFRLVQRQVNDSIVNFNPSKPSPIVNALMSNPKLIPFALRQLKEPIAEIISIIDRIEANLNNTDDKRNNDLQKQLVSLHRRLQSLFGLIMPHSLTARIPESIPALVDSINGFVSQFASMFAIFSQSVREMTNVGRNGSLLNTNKNKTELIYKVQNMCSILPTMLQMSTSEELSIRQESLSDVLTSLVSAVFGLLSTPLTGLLSLVGALLSTVVSTLSSLFSSGGSGLFEGESPVLSARNENIIPMIKKKIDDFEQMTVGLVTSNQLVITNIMTKNMTKAIKNNDLLKELKGRKTYFKRMSLFSLQTMMSSVANNMANGTEPKYMSAIQCQIDGLGCSLRKDDRNSDYQSCLKTLSNCIAA